VIRLFGPLAVEEGGRTLGPRDLGGKRPKQVLEILLAAGGHPVPTDRLADLLWGGELPQNAAGSIQTFVSVLRRHLTSDRDRARELVVTEAEAYRFATNLIERDLDRFDELLERSAREPTHDARRSLAQALELVRGEVLEDEPYAAWAQDLRGTYQGRVLGAHLDAAEAALAELDYGDALAHAEAGAALDRFSERAHRIAMLALYALGRQHDALETYRGFRARLDEELGLEPTSETRALESAILRREDPRSLLPRPIRPTGANASARPVRLLGRMNELDALERAARQALDGSFALIQIDGEAGFGKTRLLDELAATLVGVRVGRASCSELERHLPYVPLAAALRDAFTGAELDGKRLPALREILPELALGEPREFGQVDALEALVALLADHAPLTLLLDDLQWADPTTLAALRYLQGRRAVLRAAVVTAVRPDEMPPDHPVRLLHPDTRVQLKPLTAAELAPLGIPDLHEATGGNPRFVNETVANGTPPDLSSTFAESLLARCRAEGAWTYRVLVAASVLEQPFEPEPLAALLRVDAAELIEELERLCEGRILRIDGLRFRFRYDLLREALLESLSPARQRLLQERLEHSADDATSSAPLRQPLAEMPQHRDGSFDRLFARSSEPVFVLDPHDDRILAANAAGCAMLGYTCRELLETPISHIHPAELPQLLEFLERVLRDGQGSTINLTCRTKSGNYLPTEMSLHAFNEDGRLHILGLVQDRSEHRQRDPGD
jgi:PAS domain S-box-containing protein